MTQLTQPIPDNPSPVYFVPLWIWNRLESRPRKEDFTDNLRATIHDPLWMLARQWQFGEYNHDDTGTGVMAKLNIETTQLSRFKPNVGNLEAFDMNIPLEVKVEREAVNFTVRDSIVLGDEWVRIVNEMGAGFTGSPQFDSVNYREIFRQAFPFTPANQEFDISSPDQDVFESAPVYSNNKALRLVKLIAGRKIDGKSIYNAVTGATPQDLSNNPNIPAGHAIIIQQAITAFIAWVRSVYSLPEPGKTSWDSSALEYKFTCVAPKTIGTAGNPNTYSLLQADDYGQGKLDWYSFNLADDNQAAQNQVAGTPPGVNDNVIRESVISLIPAQSRFAGMPATRWWEFEDGNVNFSKIDASTTDIAKILLSQFSLVYQDDWFLLPYKMPIGSVTDIKGITVKDVFGINTLVMAAGSYEYDSNGNPETVGYDEWNKWNLYSLSPNTPDYNTVQDNAVPLGNFAPARVDKRLFFPPTLYKTMESEPLESVLFLRDEVANMVWGIEKNVTDFAGYKRDGTELARDLVSYLESVKPYTEPAQIDGTPNISFRLGNTVPENWIPFVPVHKNDFTNRNIRLQRASMPRVIPHYSMGPVRPNTSILGEGIYTSAIDNSLNVAYFINEEAVPKAGVIVEKNFQRVRWLNGKTFVWAGRKKVTGRGEGASGLKFDEILTTKNSQV